MPKLSALFVIKQPPNTFHRSFKTDPRAFRFLRIPRHKCSTGCLIKKTPHETQKNSFFSTPFCLVASHLVFSRCLSFSHHVSWGELLCVMNVNGSPPFTCSPKLKQAPPPPQSVLPLSVCLSGCFYPPAPQSVLACRSTGSLPGLRQPYERLEIQCESDMKNRQ